MRTIALHSNNSYQTTTIANIFFTDYMPKANGEFVKIYLYLLYCLQSQVANLSIGKIAEALDYTEKDVTRALKFWEKESLLSLETDNGEISAIILKDLTTTVATKSSPNIEGTESGTSLPKKNKKPEAATTQSVYSAPAINKLPEKVMLTPDRLNSLMNNQELSQLFFVCEQYLGKTLSLPELSTITYFYDDLKFSADLIEFLIEYCVSKGTKSMRYIETVALAWAKENITTVEQAKSSSSQYSKEYFGVLNAFGIKGRSPAKSEMDFMNTWFHTYDFTLDIVIEACNRTINQTHQPSFPYANSILSGWYKNGVKHLADIEPLDQVHQQSVAKTASEKTPAKSTGTKFNNFKSNSYDFSALENDLVSN